MKSEIRVGQRIKMGVNFFVIEVGLGVFDMISILGGLMMVAMVNGKTFVCLPEKMKDWRGGDGQRGLGSWFMMRRSEIVTEINERA